MIVGIVTPREPKLQYARSVDYKVEKRYLLPDAGMGCWGGGNVDSGLQSGVDRTAFFL